MQRDSEECRVIQRGAEGYRGVQRDTEGGEGSGGSGWVPEGSRHMNEFKGIKGARGFRMGSEGFGGVPCI